MCDWPDRWPPSSVLPGTIPPRCLHTTAHTRRSPSLRPSLSRPSEDAAARWSELREKKKKEKKKRRTWLHLITVHPLVSSVLARSEVCFPSQSLWSSRESSSSNQRAAWDKDSKINSGADWSTLDTFSAADKTQRKYFNFFKCEVRRWDMR